MNEETNLVFMLGGPMKLTVSFLQHGPLQLSIIIFIICTVHFEHSSLLIYQ